MKAKNWIIVLTLVVVLVALLLFINEREKARRKDEIIDRLRDENRGIKRAYLGLLEKYLKATGNVEPSVIKELQKLRSEIDDLDTAVHVELESVIKRMSDGEDTKAVKDLAKIVENILKEKAKADEAFNKKPTLNNLLEYAKDKGLICPRLYENSKKLREIRNKESHDLAPVYSKIEIGMSIFTGIEIIIAVK